MLLLFTRIKPRPEAIRLRARVVVVASYGGDALGYGSHITPGMPPPHVAAVESKSAPLIFQRTTRKTGP